jgi:hypothetical protein
MARFKPGESGNPKGRPRLSPVQVDLRRQIREAAPGIVARLVELAEGGDTSAMKLALDKVLPSLKPQDETVSLPLGAATPAASARLVLEAVGSGQIAPDAGATLLSALAAQARIIEVSELEGRIAALEARNALPAGEAA